MPRARKGNIVQRIIRSDEAFKEFWGELTKSDYKKIYNRCFVRLQRRGLSKERIQSFLVDEIRSELFKLLPKPETEIITDAQIEERELEAPEYKIKMHGVDVWQHHVTNSDPLKELEDTFNEHVSGYMSQICPRCRSFPCVCRNEIE